MGDLGGKEAKNLSKNSVHTLPVSTLYTHTQTVPKDYYTERLSYRVISLPPCTKDFLMSSAGPWAACSQQLSQGCTRDPGYLSFEYPLSFQWGYVCILLSSLRRFASDKMVFQKQTLQTSSSTQLPSPPFSRKDDLYQPTDHTWGSLEQHASIGQVM